MKILIRIDATWISQPGDPASHESSYCLALTKIWSIDLLMPDEEDR